MNNNYVKIDCGRFYEVTTTNSDLYKDLNQAEREKCIKLTNEEAGVVNKILENNYTIKETLALTKDVFGKNTFINL